MQSTISLKQVSHPRYEFRVRWHENGKDQQKWFTKGQKEAAKLFMQRKEIELGNHGTKHGTIADDERAALILFRGAVAAMPEPRPSLLDCVNAYLAGIKNQLKPITVHQLVALRAQEAAEEGARDRTMRDLIGADGTKGRLGAFAATFGDRQAASISVAEIKQWLIKSFPTGASRREVMIRLHGLFKVGIEQEHLLANPIKRIPLPKPNAARAHILSVPECAQLLATCPVRSVPALAVQLFAGLRRAEAERLDWQDINFTSKTVKVIQRKGAGSRREKIRFVPLLPALLAWLEPHRKLTGSVFPTGRKEGKASDQCYRDDFESARASAKLTEWDENSLRHSFGSYRVADTQDLEKTKLEMGHTTSRTTSEFYVNAVLPDDAKRFWAILPQPEAPANVTQMIAKTA